MSKMAFDPAVIDRRLLRRIFEMDDEHATVECLRIIQARLPLAEWLKLLGATLFHLSVEVLVEDSAIACLLIHRLIEKVPTTAISRDWKCASLACLSRATAPCHPDIFDRVVTLLDADPTIQTTWPCICCSACSLARARCVGRTCVDLAIHSFNFGALERILARRSDASPSSLHALVPLFRTNRRVVETIQCQTIEVLKTFFPEPSCPELYASARLLAILTDAKEGVIDQLPVEEIGQLGRALKSQLADLADAEGTPIIFLVASLPITVGSRDIVFRFLVDMKVPLTGLDKSGCNLLLHALRVNPDFWKSQREDGIAPASSIGDSLTSLKVPDFYRRCHHICSDFTILCRCTMCALWKSGTGRKHALTKWLGWENWIFDGYELLNLVKSDTPNRTRIAEMMKGKCDKDAVDHRGSSALHLARDVEVVRELLVAGFDIDHLDNAGMSALDVALATGQTAKAVLLITEFNATVTTAGLTALCGLAEGDRKLGLDVLKACRRVRDAQIKPSWTTAVINAQKRAKIAEVVSKQKVHEIETRHEQATSSLKRKAQQDIRELTDSHDVSIAGLKAETSNISAKLHKSDAFLHECRRKIQELLTQNAEKDAAIKRAEELKALEAAKRDKERSDMEVENESRDCTMCYVTHWDTALYCGHCYCFACAQAVCRTTCPVCAKKTNGKLIKLFNCQK